MNDDFQDKSHGCSHITTNQEAERPPQFRKIDLLSHLGVEILKKVLHVSDLLVRQVHPLPVIHDAVFQKFHHLLVEDLHQRRVVLKRENRVKVSDASRNDLHVSSVEVVQVLSVHRVLVAHELNQHGVSFGAKPSV